MLVDKGWMTRCRSMDVDGCSGALKRSSGVDSEAPTGVRRWARTEEPPMRCLGGGDGGERQQQGEHARQRPSPGWVPVAALLGGRRGDVHHRVAQGTDEACTDTHRPPMITRLMTPTPHQTEVTTSRHLMLLPRYIGASHPVVPPHQEKA